MTHILKKTSADFRSDFPSLLVKRGFVNVKYIRSLLKKQIVLKQNVC